MINKYFSLLFFSSMISTVGSSMTYIALYWAYFERTTVLSIALLTTITFIANFIFSLCLSPLCDTFRPKNLMMFTMISRTAILIIFSVGLIFFEIHIYFMIIMLIAIIALESMYDPSSLKIITHIVEEQHYVKANAWLSILDKSGYLFGLLLGGFIISVLNLGTILLIEAIAFLIGFVILSKVKTTETDVQNDNADASESYFDMWRRGMGYIFKTRWLYAILVVAVAANFAITPTITLLVPYIHDIIGGGSIAYAWVQVASVIGGMLMAFVIGKIALKNVTYTFLLAAMTQGLLIIALSFVTHIAMVILSLIHISEPTRPPVASRMPSSA